MCVSTLKGINSKQITKDVQAKSDAHGFRGRWEVVDREDWWFIPGVHWPLLKTMPDGDPPDLKETIFQTSLMLAVSNKPYSDRRTMA